MYSMKFTIKIDYTSSQTISLHTKVLDTLTLSNHKKISVSIGAIKKEITLAEHQEQGIHYLYVEGYIYNIFTSRFP